VISDSVEARRGETASSRASILSLTSSTRGLRSVVSMAEHRDNSSTRPYFTVVKNGKVMIIWTINYLRRILTEVLHITLCHLSIGCVIQSIKIIVDVPLTT